jgi:hypothetical protein
MGETFQSLAGREIPGPDKRVIGGGDHGLAIFRRFNGADRPAMLPDDLAMICQGVVPALVAATCDRRGPVRPAAAEYA